MDNEKVFLKFGLSKGEVKGVMKSAKKQDVLKKIIEESGISPEGDIPIEKGKLIIQLGLTKNVENLPHRKSLLRLIVEDKITKKTQLTAGVLYVKNVSESKFSEESLNTECGVGLVITKEEVEKAIKAHFSSISKEDVSDDPTPGAYLRKLKEKHPNFRFFDGREFMNILKNEMCTKLGVKTLKGLKKKKKKHNEKPISSLHFKVRNLPIERNKPSILKFHNEKTGGKIVTRFPPEPNGYLHIGHAKAMLFDFGFSQENGGWCYLRFDDTNPTKELPEFYEGIKKMVKWLGFKANYVTNASDYFDKLYGHANELIKRGLAYVDFSTKKEIEKQRQNKEDSPYRTKFSKEENLKLLEKMRMGYYKEGECCLRAKIDSQNDNPNMRDFVCYRIQYKEHSNPKVGNKWCIYPTYDFTHCMVDSYENITHSMCTLEFETRRDSYFWLLDSLDLYKPKVWEFSRLNLSRALLSKRKINKLVEKGVIKSFDDPRLFTLVGLKRRGYTPEIIKKFVFETGASRTATSIVDVAKLEQCCRKNLDKNVNRLFAVKDPLKIVITNFEERKYKLPNHPKDKKKGFREINFEKVLFIEREDFRLVDDPNFFGLSVNKVVGLRYGPNVVCNEVVKDSTTGNIKMLKCTADYDKKVKPKGQLHWLGEKNSTTCELRFYDYLLKCDVLTSEMDLEKYINYESEIVHKNCLVEKGILVNKNERFQFERIGYFVRDYDSTEVKLVFNCIVGLKESKDKKKLK